MSRNVHRPTCKIIVNGLDVSEALHLKKPFAGSRTGIGYNGPITVTVRFTLAGRFFDDDEQLQPGALGNISLNPIDQKLWQAGNTVRIQFDWNDGRGFIDPPFGATTRIVRNNQYQNLDALYGEFIPGVELLTLECECALKAQIGPERPTIPYTVDFNNPQTLNQLFQQTADARGIIFSPTVNPPRSLRVRLGTNQQGEALINWWNKLYCCSPPAANQFYQLYANNLNEVDVALVDLEVAPILSLERTEIPGMKFGLDGRTPQLYGLLKVEGIVVGIEDKQDPPPVPTFNDGVRTLTEYFCPNFVVPTYRVHFRQWQPQNTLFPDITTSNEVLAKDSWIITSYVQDKVDKIIETERIPSKLIDPTSNIQSPSFANRKTTLLQRDSNGRITMQTIIEDSVWGLIANSGFPIPLGVSPFVEVRKSLEILIWTALDNGKYDLLRFIWDRTQPKRSIGLDHQASSSFGPPHFDDRPGDFNVTDTKVFAQVPLAFEDINEALSEPLYGQGTFTLTGSGTFSGKGVYTSGTGANTLINDKTFVQTDGNFNGTGWFSGSGTFVGKQFVNKGFTIDVGNLIATAGDLQLFAQNESKLLTGFYYGHRAQLSMRDLPVGYLPVGSVIDVKRRGENTKDRLMIHSDEWSINEFNESFYAIYNFNGLHLATVNSITNSVKRNVSFVSQDEVFADRDEITFANGETVVFQGSP